ncbi:MAG: VCBS repeat-containing protein [Lewinellaceae bacterium]|nr:VCBS repeat-containing protein [Lewinellaceae bacterium]
MKLRSNLLSALLLLALTTASISACKKDSVQKRPVHDEVSGEEQTLEASQPLLRLVKATESGILFENTIQQSLQNNLVTNANIYNGGGVAVADFNNDGLPDLYFVASNGPNALYLNKGKLKFENASEKAGVKAAAGFKTAAVAVDIDSDGWMDIYLCRAGTNVAPEDRRNLLFVNQQDGTFKEMGAQYGLDNPSLSVGANFFDFDRDGDLDLYLLNTPTKQSYINQLNANQNPKTGKFVPDIKPYDELDSDRMYRNDGHGKFTDISKKAGIWNLGYSQSVSVSDFNNDGYPDVYVANDYVQPDLLYINNRNGTFTNHMADYFEHSAQHTMGTDLADFDNDGMVDLLSLDMAPVKHYRRKTTTNTNAQSRYNTILQYGYFEPVVRNTLQRNNGNGTFSDIACMAGVYRTDWSWGCLLFDIDNDGWKDIGISNGFRREVTDADFTTYTYPQISERSTTQPFQSVEELLQYIPVYKVRNFLYRNKGDWTFEDMSGKWATMPASWSNGSAYADLDADGDLDWIINNLEAPPFLYENLSAGQPSGHYLQLSLQGGANNPNATGATVHIRAGGQQQYQELYPTRGIFSSVEPLVHFGLGEATQVDQVVVRWPNGQATTMTNVKADQRLQLKQSDAGPAQPSPAPVASLFQKNNNSGINFAHTENLYDDLDQQFLQPWRLSELGPAMAVGDVNADGLDDVYLGNAFNAAPGLYQQLPDGSFVSMASPDILADQRYEDNGAVFFDADADGDQDLFVVSGGVEGNGAPAWQSRLYLNNGQGLFNRAPQGSLPEFKDCAMRVLAADIDGDGDTDLLIGGRVVPGKYPTSPRSVVLRNDKGRFTDATAEAGGDFENCGMVTDMKWTDLDKDGQAELLVGGEWMPLSVFKFKGGKFKNVTADFGFEKSNGFWNCLAVADLDGDGDQDIVSGNFGLNSPIYASEQAPFRCFAKDFDGNGSIDPILAYYEDGFLYPFRHRDILIKQIPGLKKKYVHYKEFGLAIVDDLFEPGQMEQSQQLFVYTLETSLVGK